MTTKPRTEVKVQTQQQQNRPSFPAGIAMDPACCAADEFVAMFPTRLALERWMRGGDIPHVFSSRRNAPVRAAWYDQAQRDFQCWLEDGGFHAE
jgi:hypothetical protein